MHALLLAVRTPTLSIIALAYGLSALATCVGIWRMRSWMGTAMSCWVASIAAFGIYMSVAMPTERFTLMVGLGFFVPLAFLVAALWLYVAQLKKQTIAGTTGNS